MRFDVLELHCTDETQKAGWWVNRVVLCDFS